MQPVAAQVFGQELAELVVVVGADQLIGSGVVYILINRQQSSCRHHNSFWSAGNDSAGVDCRFLVADKISDNFSGKIILARHRIFCAGLIDALSLNDPATIIIKRYGGQVLACRTNHFCPGPGNHSAGNGILGNGLSVNRRCIIRRIEICPIGSICCNQTAIQPLTGCPSVIIIIGLGKYFITAGRIGINDTAVSKILVIRPVVGIG